MESTPGNHKVAVAFLTPLPTRVGQPRCGVRSFLGRSSRPQRPSVVQARWSLFELLRRPWQWVNPSTRNAASARMMMGGGNAGGKPEREPSNSSSSPPPSSTPPSAAAGGQGGGSETSQPGEKDDNAQQQQQQQQPESAHGEMVAKPEHEAKGKAAAGQDGDGDDDILNSKEFLRRKIDILEQEIKTLRKELEGARAAVDGERDSVLRMAAEFDNFRRRSVAEKHAEETRGRVNAIRAIAEAIDSFDRAAQQLKPQSEEAVKVHQSYLALHKLMMDRLRKVGLELLDPTGQPFDPNMHEAIQRVESHEHPEGCVVSVFQKGLWMRVSGDAAKAADAASSSNGTLIRPAMCVVSSGPGPSQPPSAPGQEEKAADAGSPPDATAGGEQKSSSGGGSGGGGAQPPTGA